MVRPFRRVRLLGTVPISIAAHLVAIVLLLIIPLLANMTTPLPNETAAAFVRAAAAPPPPAASRPVTDARAPIAPRSNAAPTSAPPAIVRDPTTSAVPLPQTAAGILGSDAATLGTAVSAVAPARAPEPPARVGPIRAAELPVAPVKIVDVRPVYPEIARAAHVDGTVTLECVIDTSGLVTNIHVISSVPLLDRAAVEAVRQWRYRPSLYNGRPVSVLMTVTVRFVIQ